MQALTMSDLEAGDVLEVGRLGMAGWLDWAGPFAVVRAEGHSVVVRDERGPGYEPEERVVSYAQIRRRILGCALPAWLVRERAGRSFQQGDRVMTPRGAGVVVYRRMAPPDWVRVGAYSVKLDGVDHTGVIYGPESVEAACCYACDGEAVGVRDLRYKGGRVENACERHAEARS